MTTQARTLEAIKFDRQNIKLDILNQLLLPYSTTYIPITTIEDAFQTIKLMQVRGAPAIAIVGTFSVVVDTFNYLQSSKGDKSVKDLIGSLDYLITSRPTAVNLANALNDIKELLASYGETDVVNQEIYDKIYEYAVRLYDEDLANNKRIGENGLNYIVDTLKQQNFKGAFSIITICNTGSLATSGHGTALGIIRSTYEALQKDKSTEDFYLDHVYPCETRPYNQGAKLTTYELDYEQIPFTLICDNMVSSLVNTLGSDKKIKDQQQAPVKFIIVGADRVVKNGDTANKIGTFQLSTIANFFNTNKFGDDKQIKFIVAAPKTTIDLNTATGDEIVIEERPANELTTLVGPQLNQQGDVGEKVTVGVATPGISVWNPAFDVTPHELIDSIVTEDPKVFVKDANGNFTLTK
ncbi:Methylthioribose-1-phosphate isomerase [Candida viswanathii]|uniref:Methylthioribose-1-phosphate isomerase n=1 Tax=Candida viswanathii TaxID=5486 RepID=A0A367XML7_9ASCO|nr:Methylthioribose-1-phosphate isomerase [Candida viswanathii]